MKVLITGAGGQLGKELTKQLKEKDITVIALTRSMLNIADQQAVRHAMRHFRPDIVVSAVRLYVCGSMRNRNGKSLSCEWDWRLLYSA